MRALLEKIKRMIFWGWKMRNSYDFDASTLYDMIYYKLDRVYNCFLEDSHCVWNDGPNTKGMRKLRIARELARRLKDETYTYHYEQYLLKYEPERLSTHWTSWTIRNRKEFKRAIQRDSAMQKRDNDYLFKLLNKNLTHWWD